MILSIMGLLIFGSTAWASFNFRDIEVINSSNAGVKFKYVIQDQNIREEKFFIANKLYTIFVIDGTFRKESPGSFDLPSKEVFVGIPQEGEISITAYSVRNCNVTNVEIPPVPYKSWDMPSVYEIKDTSTKLLCEVTTIGYFRDNRIACLKINPIQYDYLTKEATINTEIVVDIKFDVPATDNYYQDYFDNVGSDFILNWEIAKRWKRTTVFENSNGGICNYPTGFTNWYKIKIESTGVYKINYQELKKVGIPVNLIDPRTIRIFNIGDYVSNVYYPDTLTEIPIYVAGEDDGRFDKNDYILFFGLSPSRFSRNRSNFFMNPFTKYNYYWLTWGISLATSGHGKRYSNISTYPSGVNIYTAYDYAHLEQDRDCPARNGLLWIWEYFSKGEDIQSRTFRIPLSLSYPETLITISGRLYGKSTSNRVGVGVNGILLNTFTFSGATTNPPPFDFEVSCSQLLVDSNFVEFILSGNPQQEVFLDYLNCRYKKQLNFTRDTRELTFYSPPGSYNFVIVGKFSKPLIFDITDYHNPKMVTEFQYANDTLQFALNIIDTVYFYITDDAKARRVLKLERRNVTSIPEYANAHYYIVAPDELYNSALIIENYRRNNLSGINNARVKAVPLSKIFDDFTFGIEEPGAIKRLFKKYRPYYGLLLGDGTYDYRNILGLVNFPALLSYEAGYDIDYQVYSANAIALDAWYADFEGNGRTPDMALGRVTARNPGEARQFYNKLVNYENLNVGDWTRKFIFLSDDEWKGQGVVDEFRFEHIVNNENLEFSLLHTTNGRFNYYEPVKIYLTEYPFSESRDKRKAREAFLDAVNKGATLLCFFGHGAGFQLCHEQVLHITHIPLINNGLRNFIGFFGSCGVGRFEDTKYESIAEELVRQNDGAIVTIASSKATYSNVNYALAVNFFRNIINITDSTIGSMFLRTWMYDSTYHFFGDPATRPAIPNKFYTLFAPDTFKSGERVYAQTVITNNNPVYISATTSRWRRTYQSEVGTINYNLNGYDIFRGITRRQCSSDTTTFYFVVPIRLPRKVRYDVLNGAGYYTEIFSSSRISAIGCNQQDRSIDCYLKDSIFFDTIMTATNLDREGPQINFLTEGRILRDCDTITPGSIMTVNLVDSSGILIAPVVGYNLRLNIKKFPHTIIDNIDVSAYFMYDIGDFTRGQIQYPVLLDTGRYVFTVYASDNLCNLSIDSIILNVVPCPKLEVSNALFYMLPSNKGYFTFELNKPTFIEIRIYSLAGKLVKSFYNNCHSGYNQILWDLTDINENPVGNGVYLYEISASSFNQGIKESYKTIGKMIIFR
ncbi:MAG: C25 family cysteine peptidase [candidate division WOR-3 bacterium]